MKYIIMCGGEYKNWKIPKQLIKIGGEPIVLRTIRLLKENGIDDISISSNNSLFKKCGVPVLQHDNYWQVMGVEDVKGTWVSGFYHVNEPVCYVLGDVVFSRAAIKKIVETETDSVAFFASAPPFAKEYRKPYAEPFAFKVMDTKYFRTCILKVRKLENQSAFIRHPIAWELWQVIKNTPLNRIDYTNYTVINDYTCDIDWPEDIKLFSNVDLEK